MSFQVTQDTSSSSNRVKQEWHVAILGIARREISSASMTQNDQLVPLPLPDLCHSWGASCSFSQFTSCPPPSARRVETLRSLLPLSSRLLGGAAPRAQHGLHLAALGASRRGRRCGGGSWGRLLTPPAERHPHYLTEFLVSC